MGTPSRCRPPDPLSGSGAHCEGGEARRDHAAAREQAHWAAGEGGSRPPGRLPQRRHSELADAVDRFIWWYDRLRRRGRPAPTRRTATRRTDRRRQGRLEFRMSAIPAPDRREPLHRVSREDAVVILFPRRAAVKPSAPAKVEDATPTRGARDQRPWTEEEVRILVEAWFEGLRPADLAARLPGRSLSAVKVRASRLQLPRRDKADGKLVAPPLAPEKTQAPAAKSNEAALRRPGDTAKMRACLRCETQFYSSWAGDRICGSCRRSDDWQSGDPWYVSHDFSTD